jgi:hypothetical protein
MVCSSSAQTQVNVAVGYNWDTADSLWEAFGSIRATAYDPDLLGDGVSAIAATDYGNDGVVHVFKTLGDNAIEAVWTSPIPDSLGGGSTPRHVVFADLDNDGRKEVIFHRRYAGLMIFEWDGVAGSYNFGTEPAQQITVPTIKHGTSSTEYCEFLEVGDYDNDGMQELIIAYNSAPNENDNYYVISAVGNWDTGNPGFSSFDVEWTMGRTAPGDYGLGGSPIAMIGADLDGDQDKDILIHNWNFQNFLPLTTEKADSFVIADTTNGKAHYYATYPSDKVSLMGGMAADVDKDGREEVYMPVYSSTGGWGGKVNMVHYEEGQSTHEIDSSNVFLLDLTPVGGDVSTFGHGQGDIDQDGKTNLYFGQSYGYNVVSAEFQGGDKLDPANWLIEVIYPGDSTIFSSVDIERDSTAVADGLAGDSTWNVNTAFVSNMSAKFTDFDKDGYEDIILPFQALEDSIPLTTKTWTDSMYIDTIDSTAVIDSSGVPWDTTYTYDTTWARYWEESTENVINPKRWSLRIIEGTALNSIEAKDVKIITPQDYVLKQNYPNPFNPETTIEFILPVRKRISLTVYNALGQKIKTLYDNKVLTAGMHEVVWDGRNDAGNRVATGMYIYALKFGNYAKNMKMMLVK